MKCCKVKARSWGEGECVEQLWWQVKVELWSCGTSRTNKAAPADQPLRVSPQSNGSNREA